MLAGIRVNVLSLSLSLPWYLVFYHPRGRGGNALTCEGKKSRRGGAKSERHREYHREYERNLWDALRTRTAEMRSPSPRAEEYEGGRIEDRDDHLFYCLGCVVDCRAARANVIENLIVRI